jgi:hypothetical protein
MMARKTICLVGPRWTRTQALGRDCAGREHRHIDPEEAEEMARKGEARWLVGGLRRGRVIEGSVLQDRVEGAKQALNRLSIEVGETHAMMIYRGDRIAVEMLHQIRRKARG